ncbi:AAA family ATPase [Hominifimenecus sp. rT4P-3]|uniref:cytidylate kinase-like family protein n=1 Tax=Hominifimenecus sp. rT4P-3 TaxID=3242979 RepID=UPI003DA357C1
MAHTVIALGRQYGSNGRKIAQELAKRLNIPYYDKNLIYLASESTDIPPDVLAKVDEKKASDWRRPVDDPYQMQHRFRFYPMNDLLFETQAKIIRELAEKEDCIVIGRCADYILKEHPGCCRVFIYAPYDARVKNVIERESLPMEKVEELIREVDKQRRTYYNYYTDAKWGEKEYYDICLDSSKCTIDQAVDLLEVVFRNRQKK